MTAWREADCTGPEEPLATTDGGRTWHRFATPCNGWPDIVVAATATRNWAVCGSVPATDMQFGKRLYVSSGDRESWVRVRTRLPLVGVLAGAAFDPAGTGFVWFDRAGLDVTTDGGRSWTSLPIIDLATANAGCDNAIDAQALGGGTAVMLGDRCSGDTHTIDLRASANDGRRWRLIHSWVAPNTYGAGRWP